MSNRTELSVVIPVYNSAEVFPHLFKRLFKTLSEYVESFEVIAVVDGCPDDSAEVISSYCKTEPRMKMVELSRNFGEEAAVTAGLRLASGDMVVVMDDDLEDRPEEIPRFVEKAKEGYDVVYGVIKKREVSLFRRLSYYFFYRFLNRLTDINIPHDAGSFCLMRQPVVKALNTMPETNRYIRGMRIWLGFKQTGLEYERDKRFAGKSGYNVSKYVRFALDGILSFSYKPLKYVAAIGFIMSALSFAFGVRLIVLKVLDKVRDVPGWVSLMVAVLFLGGIQLFAIGMVGQYIARIYDEVKKRPMFVIKRVVGFEEGTVDSSLIGSD